MEWTKVFFILFLLFFNLTIMLNGGKDKGPAITLEERPATCLPLIYSLVYSLYV